MRLTIVCLFALYAVGAQAQVDIVNTSYIARTNSVLYARDTNLVIIKGETGIKYNLVSMHPDDVSIYPAAAQNTFIVIPKCSNYDDTLIVMEGKTLITSKYFRTIYKREPTILVSNYLCYHGTYSCVLTMNYWGKLSLEEMLKTPFLSIVESEKYKLSEYAIRSFEFSATTNDGLLPPILNKGADFNPKVIDEIKNKLTIGGKVFIENIKVYTPEGIRTLDQSIILNIIR